MAGKLTRRSSGLTPAHKALIRLLAEAAVRDYLAEVEAEAHTTHADHREIPIMTTATKWQPTEACLPLKGVTA
jgi:hypothetical protein